MSRYVSRVIVSTDDPEIASIAVRCGAEIPFLRPAHLATDTASMSSVVNHLLRYLNSIQELPEAYILLQPTCPMRTTKHIDEAASMFQEGAYASLMSVSEVNEHPYIMKKIENQQLVDFVDLKDKPTRRQDYPPIYRLNGAIFIGRSRLFLRTDTFQLEPCCPYIMSKEDSIDIDTMDDFIAAELRMRRMNK